MEKNNEVIPLSEQTLVQKLENAQKRENELKTWVLSHSYENPLFEQRSRDLNNASYKVQALKDRIDPPGKGIGETQSQPSINI
jgi:DNA-directed RNA polymerase specialized sigma54-like protein